MKIEDTFYGIDPRLDTGESTSLVAKPNNPGLGRIG